MREIKCPHCQEIFKSEVNKNIIYCPSCGLNFENEIKLSEASDEDIYDELHRRGVVFKIFGDEKKKGAGVGVYKFENAPFPFKKLSNHGGDEDWIIVAPKDKYEVGLSIATKLMFFDIEVCELDNLVVFYNITFIKGDD